MKKSLILSLGIALSVALVGCSNDSDQTSKHIQSTKQNDPFEQYQKDAKKFTKDEPVNHKKSQNEFSKEVINADGKVLYDSDAEGIGSKARAYILKLNSTLGENVFIQSKDGSRTDLLIQSDDTEYPKAMIEQEDYDEKNAMYDGKKAIQDLPTFIQTSNNRLIYAEGLYTLGKSDDEIEFDKKLERAINQSVGIKSDISDKESVRQEFKNHRDKVLKNGSFSNGIRPDTKDKQYLGEDNNKSLEVAKEVIPEIQNNRKDFKDVNSKIEDTDLNKIIDSVKITDFEATIQAGKDIQKIFKSINKNDGMSEFIDEKDTESTNENGKTVVGTNSSLDKLTQDYFMGQ